MPGEILPTQAGHWVPKSWKDHKRFPVLAKALAVCDLEAVKERPALRGWQVAQPRMGSLIVESSTKPGILRVLLAVLG